VELGFIDLAFDVLANCESESLD
jgi:hypothetical protein